MDSFPHRYSVAALAVPDGDIALEADRLPSLRSAAPREFGGPGDRWSPETLLVAAVADCFVLTFRAVARGHKLSWRSVRCDVEGTLDRIDRATQFTEFTLDVRLVLPAGSDEALAHRLLEKSKDACLITSSLKGTSRLKATVEIGTPAAA